MHYVIHVQLSYGINIYLKSIFLTDEFLRVQAFVAVVPSTSLPIAKKFHGRGFHQRFSVLGKFWDSKGLFRSPSSQKTNHDRKGCSKLAKKMPFCLRPRSEVCPRPRGVVFFLTPSSKKKGLKPTLSKFCFFEQPKLPGCSPVFLQKDFFQFRIKRISAQLCNKSTFFFMSFTLFSLRFPT